MEGKFEARWQDMDFAITDEDVYNERLPIAHNVRMIGAMLCNLMYAYEDDPTDIVGMRSAAKPILGQIQGLLDRLYEEEEIK